MADVVTCPDCDERITVHDRSTGVKCPACGTQVLKPAGKERAASKVKSGSKPRKYRDDDDDYDHDHPKGRNEPDTNGVPTGAIVASAIIVVVVAIALFAWAVAPGPKPTGPSPAAGAPNPNPNPNPNPTPRPNPAPVPAPAAPAPVDTSAAEAALPALVAPFATDPLLERPERPVYLVDMQEFGVRMGPWRFGKGDNGDAGRSAIKVNGVPATKGLGVHPGDNAATRVAYALGGRSVTLAGAAGLNDYGFETWSPVVFKIVGDGRDLWQSEPTTRASGPVKFRVDVRGVRILELRAITLGSHLNAHAAWMDPLIEK